MAKITAELEVDITTEIFAKWFCSLDDEKQADVFVAITNEAKSWDNHQGSQWFLVGKHLLTCECSTPEAQNMVEELYNGLKAYSDG